MLGTIIARAIDRSQQPPREREYGWEVPTLTEGRRTLRGLKRRGIKARLVRADGKVEEQP